MHQRIASNLVFAIEEHLRSYRPDLCACFGVGLMVPGADLFRARADVAVFDAMADYESYTDKFYLVAEVLCDGNTDRDIAVKRQRYLQHPDNRYFVLIEQKRIRVEVLARATEWQSQLLQAPDDILQLPDFGFTVAVSALYRGTPLAR